MTDRLIKSYSNTTHMKKTKLEISIDYFVKPRNICCDITSLFSAILFRIDGINNKYLYLYSYNKSKGTYTDQSMFTQ